jgi:hypothetical protein
MATPQLNEELSTVISQIIDIVAREDMTITLELKELEAVGEKTLSHLAKVAEARIKQKQTDKIRKKILTVVKSARNRIIVSSIEIADN